MKSWVLVPFDCRILKGSLTPIRWMAKPWKDTLLDNYPCILWNISFLFSFFFSFCFYFNLNLLVCVFWTIHIPVHWAIQTKTIEKFLRWSNFWIFVQTSMIYLWNWYLCWKILLFERSLLISIFRQSLSWSSLSFYDVPFP